VERLLLQKTEGEKNEPQTRSNRKHGDHVDQVWIHRNYQLQACSLKCNLPEKLRKVWIPPLLLSSLTKDFNF